MGAGEGYTRREFLRMSGRAGAGLALLSSVPYFLNGSAIAPEACVTRAQYLMGTVVTITAYGESRAHANEAISRAFDEMRRVDEMMSLYKPESDVSRLNRAAGREAIGVDSSVIEIIEHARSFTLATEGTFDISIEPLMELWGFRSQQSPHEMPTDTQIRNALETVGMKHVVVECAAQRAGLLNRHARIDLGGIAVGYSVDRAVEALRRAGVERAFINHSGDAYALGAPPERDGWEIGIPDPSCPSEMIATFRLHDRAASTSGNYEKYVTIDDSRVGHILDPHTGRPGRALLSATLLAPTALEADALSTGLFCKELNALQEAVKRSNCLEVFAVTEDNEQVSIRSTG